MEMKLPSVIALKEYVPQVETLPSPASTCFFATGSPASIADGHAAADLTFDHVVRAHGVVARPGKCRGGRSPCNLRKANLLPEQCGMSPLSKPVAPNIWQLQENGRGFPPNYLHESWRDYLYWDTELQQT